MPSFQAFVDHESGLSLLSDVIDLASFHRLGSPRLKKFAL